MDMIKDALMDNIVLPIIVCIGSSILLVVKHYIAKLTNSIVAKNDIQITNSEITTRNAILEEIGTLVQSAVYTTMVVATRLKKESPNGTLSDEEAADLQRRVVDLVIKALPPAYDDASSSVIQLIGGIEKRDTIIYSMVEGAVANAKNVLS
jgi:hypothetical protein|nr:MAG TPA: hypothetical protein [Caudoviricetes sp.]